MNDEKEGMDNKVMDELSNRDSDDDDSSDSRSSSCNSNDMSDEENSSDVEDHILEYDYEYSVSQQNDKDNQPLSNKQRERIQNIEVASKNVLAVIQKYGNAPLPSLDPSDYNRSSGCWRISNDSAWANTSLAMMEIVNAREGMIKAWDNDQVNNDRVGIKRQKEEQNNDDDNKWWKSIIDDDDSMEGTTNGRRSTVENMNTYSGEDFNKEKEEEALTEEEQRQFDTVHMEWATNAFAEELEALRSGQPTTKQRQQQKSLNAKSRKEEQNELRTELDPTQYSFVVAKPMENEKDDTNNNNVEESNIDVQILADMMQSGSNVLSTTEKKMLLNARNRALLRRREEGCTDDDVNKLTLHERRKRELGFLC